MILLRERDGDRILPIWTGAPEAAALAVRRSATTLPRPLPYDLMAALLGAVDVHVERVVIECLRENTYYATVTVMSQGDSHEIDARPSDALNLALRAGAPIQVSSDLTDAAGRPAWPGECEAPVDGVAAPPWVSVSERRSHSPDPTYTVDEKSPQMLRLAAAQALELGHDSVGGRAPRSRATSKCVLKRGGRGPRFP